MSKQPFKKLFDNPDKLEIGFDPAFNRIKERRAELAENSRKQVEKLKKLGYGYIESRKMPPEGQKQGKN
jgi:hypothetical protein